LPGFSGRLILCICFPGGLAIFLFQSCFKVAIPDLNGIRQIIHAIKYSIPNSGELKNTLDELSFFIILKDIYPVIRCGCIEVEPVFNSNFRSIVLSLSHKFHGVFYFSTFPFTSGVIAFDMIFLFFYHQLLTIQSGNHHRFCDLLICVFFAKPLIYFFIFVHFAL